MNEDEEKNELRQSGSLEDITFDYNQLYKNEQKEKEVVIENDDHIPSFGVEEVPIVFGNEVVEEKKEIVTDVIPGFDADALEELPDELRTNKTNEPLIKKMASDTIQEKNQFKRNLIFIGVFFAVIVFAILFIFPALNS